ncbi:MAG: peptide ABC transporter substrate-binding protein [Promethearchaeia archaeon]|nr:MAG: peptide ABC transporter substrate-binding protein [Candidatus Lokiarchaeia archaeon]
MTEPILEITNLKKYYPVKKGFFSRVSEYVKAVDGVSLSIEKEEILGIVGESGCGKTTLVNTILNLIEPNGGKVIFNNKDLFSLKKKEMREIRKDIQIVFQDPFWSLNPRMLLKDIIGEPLDVQTNLKSSKKLEKVKEMLKMVGLPEESAFKYPHEFSGGQRQRIAIARALVLMPKLVVLDEPTSSIDVISQAQILDLLLNLKKKFNLTFILISHDLSVVHYFSDKIAVMYLGKLVEYGESQMIFNNPKHPYTKALFAAIPDINTEDIQNIMTLEGRVPSAINPPKGCRFHPRCPMAQEICGKEEPPAIRLNDKRIIACYFVQE